MPVTWTEPGFDTRTERIKVRPNHSVIAVLLHKQPWLPEPEIIAVASVVGLGGMAGALTAMVFSESKGLILETTGSYWPLFAIASTAY